jgi:hypothetical protein
MSTKNDQVFQLSLTELAFMIIFILMLLLGMMVVRTVKENNELKAAAATEQGAQSKTDVLNQVTSALKANLEAIGQNKPDEVISKMVLAAEAQAETGRLKVLLEEKDKQVTALTEIEKALAEVPKDKKNQEAKAIVVQALLTMAELQKALQSKKDDEGKKLTGPQIIDKVREMQQARTQLAQALKIDEGDLSEATIEKLVKDATAYGDLAKSDTNPMALKKANSDLQGQVTYLQHKLDARGGMDFPPCWADPATGKIQMLFYVELSENSVRVTPDWPASRQQDAMALPGMDAVLSKQSYGYDDFLQAVRPIYDLSQSKTCRFYVRMKNEISDAVQSDRKRRLIENSFYKLEMRR